MLKAFVDEERLVQAHGQGQEGKQTTSATECGEPCSTVPKQAPGHPPTNPR